MRKKLTELTTSIQWVACECGSPHTHRKDCSGRTHRKFLVQSDIADDSYWLCSYCARNCVWGDTSAADDERITTIEGFGRLLGRYLK